MELSYYYVTVVKFRVLVAFGKVGNKLLQTQANWQQIIFLPRVEQLHLSESWTQAVKAGGEVC